MLDQELYDRFKSKRYEYNEQMSDDDIMREILGEIESEKQERKRATLSQALQIPQMRQGQQMPPQMPPQGMPMQQGMQQRTPVPQGYGQQMMNRADAMFPEQTINAGGRSATMSQQPSGDVFTNEDLVPYEQAGIQSPEIPEDDRYGRMLAMLETNPDMSIDDLMKLTEAPEEKERKIVKDINGRQRYLDTGKLVFADVAEEDPKAEERLRELGDNYAKEEAELEYDHIERVARLEEPEKGEANEITITDKKRKALKKKYKNMGYEPSEPEGGGTGQPDPLGLR